MCISISLLFIHKSLSILDGIWLKIWHCQLGLNDFGTHHTDAAPMFIKEKLLCHAFRIKSSKHRTQHICFRESGEKTQNFILDLSSDGKWSKFRNVLFSPNPWEIVCRCIYFCFKNGGGAIVVWTDWERSSEPNTSVGQGAYDLDLRNISISYQHMEMILLYQPWLSYHRWFCNRFPFQRDRWHGWKCCWRWQGDGQLRSCLELLSHHLAFPIVVVRNRWPSLPLLSQSSWTIFIK